MHAVQLGGTKSSPASTPEGEREQLVDELVGNIRVEFLQECGGAGGWQERVHAGGNYLKRTHLTAKGFDLPFVQQNLRAKNQLHPPNTF
jgi:hypothetical protein